MRRQLSSHFCLGKQNLLPVIGMIRFHTPLVKLVDKMGSVIGIVTGWKLSKLVCNCSRFVLVEHVLDLQSKIRQIVTGGKVIHTIVNAYMKALTVRCCRLDLRSSWGNPEGKCNSFSPKVKLSIAAIAGCSRAPEQSSSYERFTPELVLTLLSNKPNTKFPLWSASSTFFLATLLSTLSPTP